MAGPGKNQIQHGAHSRSHFLSLFHARQVLSFRLYFTPTHYRFNRGLLSRTL
jgi:hypothetical protein